MPRPNKLFYTLKSFTKRTSQSSSSTSSSSVPATPTFKLDFKFSQEFKLNFALIPLPIPKIEDFDYEITEAHISFYENMSSPMDSGYHYTATLIKSNGELTKVRAYFNQDGSIRVDSNELTEIEKDLFKNTALRETQPIIEQIKVFQQTRITQLSTTISKILEDSDSGHLQKLEEINRLNKQCITALPLVQELESIGGTMKLGNKLFSRLDALDWAKTDLMQPLPPTSAVKGDRKDNKEKEEVAVQKKEHKRRAKNKFFDKSTSSQQSSAQAVAQSFESQKEKAWQDLRISIDKLLEVENKLQQYLGLNQPRGLIPTTAELVEAQQIAKEALGSLLAYRVFEDEIPALDFLCIESSLRMIQILGIHSLEALIPKFNDPKKKAEAELLKPYAKYLNKKFGYYAIKSGNSELLDWLLEHGHFNIEDDFIMHRDGKAISSLEYAYREGDLSLFKVLIKHKAYMLIHTGKKVNLSDEIVNHADKNNPFRKELLSRHGKILRGEQLLETLRTCLSDPSLGEEQIAKINLVLAKGNAFLEKAKDTAKNQTIFNSFFNDFHSRISLDKNIGLFCDDKIFTAFKEALALKMEGQLRDVERTPVDSRALVNESLALITRLAQIRATSASESTLTEEQAQLEIETASSLLSPALS